MPQRSDGRKRATIGSVAGATLRTLSGARHTGMGWIKVDDATAPPGMDTELESSDENRRCYRMLIRRCAWIPIEMREQKKVKVPTDICKVIVGGTKPKV